MNRLEQHLPIDIDPEIRNRIFERYEQLDELGLMDKTDSWYTGHAHNSSPQRTQDQADMARKAKKLTYVPYLFLGAAVKIEDGGPLLYSAERIERVDLKNGVWLSRSDLKLRSMKLDACNMPPPEIKGSSKTDPRVTRIGQIIRRIGADELPQLYSVINGVGAITGPRAMTRAELEGEMMKEALGNDSTGYEYRRAYSQTKKALISLRAAFDDTRSLSSVNDFRQVVADTFLMAIESNDALDRGMILNTPEAMLGEGTPEDVELELNSNGLFTPVKKSMRKGVVAAGVVVVDRYVAKGLAEANGRHGFVDKNLADSLNKDGIIPGYSPLIDQSR